MVVTHIIITLRKIFYYGVKINTKIYKFRHRSTQQTWPEWMGVLHGYEINFIFGEPYNTARFKYTNEEKELSSRFMRYWANFARTGLAVNVKYIQVLILNNLQRPK